MVNRCIYCAAVHATRHVQIEKSDDVTDKIFAMGASADLDPRNKAIFQFAIALSQSPSSAGPNEIAALRDVGLDETEILDLILSTALFGWANRLMHTLGDPIARDS